MFLPARVRRLGTGLSVAAAALLALGCGSDSGTGPGTTPAIAISLVPSSASIQQGGSTQLTLNLTRTNFTGAVSYTITGAPDGVTGNAVPSSSGATIQVSASSAVTPGQYPLTVHASGTGVTEVTKNFTLTVSAASSTFFTLALGSPAMTVAVNSTGNTSVTITRTGFAGTVNLSVEGLPVYMEATTVPAAASGNTATITILTTDRMVPGVYNLTVRGSSTGQNDVTVPLTVTVP